MIINRQTRVPVAPRKLEQFLARVNRLLHLRHSAATVCLVSDAEIAKWNRTYRGKSKPTDVLSFPAGVSPSRNGSRKGKGTRRRDASPHDADFDSGPAPRGTGSQPVRLARECRREANHYLGDIAIAPAVARRNARRLGRTLDDELRVLILHGILHLLGYDHETDAGQMERLELRLRRRLGIG